VLIFKRFVNEYRADVTLNRSFNLLLSTCTRLPDHKEGLQRAIALIEAVRGTDVSPGIYAYNKLIDMCRSIVDGSDRAKSREGLEQLVKLQELMKQAGVTPDIVTYTGLVDVFGRAGLGMKAVQQGEEVLRLMKNDGIKPDVVVYNVLINNCQRGALASKSVSEILKYLNAGRDLVEAMVGEVRQSILVSHFFVTNPCIFLEVFQLSATQGLRLCMRNAIFFVTIIHFVFGLALLPGAGPGSCDTLAAVQHV
jgi:pentatricopeptide repeat protein